MSRQEAITQLRALPIEERISIIQELLETIKSEHLTEICETERITPENLFAKFASEGKVIHTSPSIKHDEPMLGAGGAIPLYPNKQKNKNA